MRYRVLGSCMLACGIVAVPLEARAGAIRMRVSPLLKEAAGRVSYLEVPAVWSSSVCVVFGLKVVTQEFMLCTSDMETARAAYAALLTAMNSTSMTVTFGWKAVTVERFASDQPGPAERPVEEVTYGGVEKTTRVGVTPVETFLRIRTD